MGVRNRPIASIPQRSKSEPRMLAFLSHCHTTAAVPKHSCLSSTFRFLCPQRLRRLLSKHSLILRPSLPSSPSAPNPLCEMGLPQPDAVRHVALSNWQSYIASIGQTQWSAIVSDSTLTAAVMVIVAAWLFMWQQLTSRNIISRLVCRKIIHITCGPALVAAWSFYTNAETAKYIASSIPLAVLSAFIVSAQSKSTSPNTSKLYQMYSRSEETNDGFNGPLYYTAILFVLTLTFFKQPVAVVTVMQLCVGDAMAELFGRKFGPLCPWPMKWAASKSVPGSLAFLISAFVTSTIALQVYGIDVLSQPQLLSSLAIVSICCAAVELAPVYLVVDDNIAIAGMAILTSTFLLGGGTNL